MKTTALPEWIDLLNKIERAADKALEITTGKDERISNMLIHAYELVATRITLQAAKEGGGESLHSILNSG